MQDINIRTATAEDFDQVGIVFAEDNQYHTHLVPEIIQIADPIMTHDWFDEVVNNPQKRLFVAEFEGQVVGVALIEIRHAVDDPIFRPRRYLYVSEIAVTAALRGRGIGRLLIEKIHQFARSQDIVEVELNVWERNDPAIGFYEKMGYQNWRRTMRYIIDENAYFAVENQET